MSSVTSSANEENPFFAAASHITLSTGWTPITAWVNGQGEYLTASDLPIGAELRNAIEQWAARYDYEFDAAQRWEYRREGWVLARQLARELGVYPPVYWEHAPALAAPAPR